MLIKTLESCIRTGSFGALRGFYDADSRLEAFLPFGTLVGEGPEEIIGLFEEWWPSEGMFVHWSATSYEAGLELVLERHPVDDDRPWTSRHWQEIQVVDGRIARQLIWSDTPRKVGEFAPLPDPIAALVDGGERRPLYEGGFSARGWSGWRTADRDRR